MRFSWEPLITSNSDNMFGLVLFERLFEEFVCLKTSLRFVCLFKIFGLVLFERLFEEFV